MENSDSNPSIIDLKMGEQFSIALSSRGYVYTWGLNDQGQLGLGNLVSQFDPVQIPSIGPTAQNTISPVNKIGCGLKHCLVLNKNYQLFSWGSNLQCQLGVRVADSQGKV